MQFIGGLSAIGALSLDIGGPSLPKHLESVKVSHIRQGCSSEGKGHIIIYKKKKTLFKYIHIFLLQEMDGFIKEAINDPLKQLWLEQRLFPFGAPYQSKDGTLILPMATFNR